MKKHLSEQLDCTPTELELTRDKAGKPHLLWPPSPLGFSLSHTEKGLLIALADGPVGVDLEIRSKAIDLRLLERHLYSPPDLEWIAAAAPLERDLRSLQIWCLNEARFKMQGHSTATASPMIARNTWGELPGDHVFAACVQT